MKMRTYFHYLFEKLKNAWKEDKGMFYFVPWLAFTFVMLLFADFKNWLCECYENYHEWKKEKSQKGSNI
jgi:hypothetical protein